MINTKLGILAAACAFALAACSDKQPAEAPEAAPTAATPAPAPTEAAPQDSMQAMTPAASRIGETVREIGTRVPSLRRRIVSK